MMIECPFATDKSSCQHIDAAVGKLVVITPDVCGYCAKTCKVDDRAGSYAVLSIAYSERQKRGLEVVGDRPKAPVKPTMIVARREHPTRPNVADELLAVARSVPRVIDAPIIDDPDETLVICEGCSDWRGERCRASCVTCKNRPRPMAVKTAPCPRGFWRRG